MEVNDNGEILEEGELRMACEVMGCTRSKGRDYVRVGKERLPGWEEEPIFLCAEHAGERRPLDAEEHDN